MSIRVVGWIVRSIILILVFVVVGCGAGVANSRGKTPAIISTVISQAITRTLPVTATSVTLPTVTKEDDHVEITIGDNYYDSQSVTVKVGTRVEWWNGGGLPHNVVALDYEWGASYLLAGARYEWTFNKAGTYIYMCTLHSGMEGTIQVVD